jgi:pimeloyl-ACP methyl ester carboxylesterase
MVKRALGRVSSPAILVGHSYGGSVITAAGTDDRVVGPVYIAAVDTTRVTCDLDGGDLVLTLPAGTHFPMSASTHLVNN